MNKLFLCLFLAACTCVAQNSTTSPSSTTDEISGMYTFLQEGEFVQVNIEDGSRVTGFVSRYGDSDSDKGAFLDQMFSEGELKGNHIKFKTRIVHGVSYEFEGKFERGDGKNPADEGYHVLRGKLTEFTEDANKKTTAKSREITMKSFPQDATVDHPQKD